MGLKEIQARQLERSMKMFNELHEQFDPSMKHKSSYPPYDIIRLENNMYAIDLAVAGFDSHELEVTLQDKTLSVKGKKSQSTSPDNYLVKCIATREFVRNFTLSPGNEIVSADLNNGILRILVQDVIPEEKKAKKIEISYQGKLPQPELLTEKETTQ